MLYPQKCVRHS